MAILTKPTISKGQANEFDLSKSDLAAVSKVVNDSYFSDQTNWSKVIVEYKSAEGNQHEMMIFDASETSPKGNFEVSEKARDNWEVQSVKIMDFDGGYLKLQRGDLTVADFDIILGSTGSGSLDLLFSQTLKSSSITLYNSGLTVLAAGLNNQRGFLEPAIPVDDGGKYYIEFNLDALSNGSLGISQHSSPPSTFSNRWPGISGTYSAQFNKSNYRAFNGIAQIATATMPSTVWSQNRKISVIIDLDSDPSNIRVWQAVDGDYGTGNDPVTNQGGLSLPKLAGNNVYLSVFNDDSSSIQFTIEITPNYSISGFTYLKL